MAKDKSKHQTGGASLNNLATGIADAARVKLVNEAMDTYEFNGDPNQLKPVEHLFARLIEGRVKEVDQALGTYKPNTSIIHPTKVEHVLAEVLNVDAQWMILFDGAYSGVLNGSLLVGVEDQPSVQTAMAIITRKYGLVDHSTLKDEKLPNHPVVEAKKKQFREQGYKTCC